MSPQKDDCPRDWMGFCLVAQERACRAPEGKKCPSDKRGWLERWRQRETKQEDVFA